MIDEGAWLRRMARSSAPDQPPALDVTATVLARLHGCEENLPADPMVWVTGIAGAVAAIVLAHAVDTWLSWQDPLGEWLTSLNLVLP